MTTGKASIKPREYPALSWLARELKVDSALLASVLIGLREKRGLYKVFYRQKRNGLKRKICAPTNPLRKIQGEINKRLLASLSPVPSAFGFSGGNVVNAIQPHLGAKTILSVDISDAFPSISRSAVFRCLLNYFSSHASWIIAELATLDEELPQGAPTSPRLFDLVFRELDRQLAELSESIDGESSRYADNILFSVKESSFPRRVRGEILWLIEHQMNRMGRFEPDRTRRQPRMPLAWHNLKIRRLNKGALRLLGLNIIKGKLHNTRAFKGRVRLTIYRLKWLLDNGRQDTPEFDMVLGKLRGQMAFAITDTLPQSTLDAYKMLEEQLC